MVTPNFVTCGLSVDCTDHELIEVLVYPGTDTININPVDWYALPLMLAGPFFQILNNLGLLDKDGLNG